MKPMSAKEYKAMTKPKRSKYGNKKCEVDGFTFDSIKEKTVYLGLRQDLLTGKISKLELQVPFKIIIGGKLICTYRSDFKATYPDGRVVIFDAKGFLTPMYRLKKKLMKAVHGIDIIEC